MEGKGNRIWLLTSLRAGSFSPHQFPTCALPYTPCSLLSQGLLKVCRPTSFCFGNHLESL